MSATVLCVAAVVLGVEFGANPLPEGGVEYIIKVEPLALESLRSGADIHSDIPLTMRDVRSFRITMVSDRVPAGKGSPQSVARDPRAGLPAFGGVSTAFGPTMPSPPELSTAAGAKFPTAPSSAVPLPKAEARSSDTKRSGLPAKVEQGAGKGAGLPSGSKEPKPTTEHKTSFFPVKESAPSAPSARPAGPKPADSVSQTSGPELPPASLGLLFSLAASTAGSLSGMVFFGWVAWDYRRRYYALLARVNPPDMEVQA